MIYEHPYKGRIEHPRGMFWDRTEEGVRLTKRTGIGEVLFSYEYTTEEFLYIADALITGEYVAPPEPEPAPAPEPTPDPAPRATGGTPDVGPVKADAPRARTPNGNDSE